MKVELNSKTSNCNFSDSLGLSSDIEKCGIYLYHSIRFMLLIDWNPLKLPDNKVKDSFLSCDGTVKYLYLNNYSDNCNMRKYVSVMSYQDHLYLLDQIYFLLLRNQ